MAVDDIFTYGYMCHTLIYVVGEGGGLSRSVPTSSSFFLHKSINWSISLSCAATIRSITLLAHQSAAIATATFGAPRMMVLSSSSTFTLSRLCVTYLLEPV